MRWDEAMAAHALEVEAIAAAAARVPPELWTAPRETGKWSRAEVLQHLVLAYDVLLGELRGGSGMKVRTKFLQRWMLRLVLVPRILAGKGFPERAPAPKEVRPQSVETDRGRALATFRERAAEFVAAMEETRSVNPRQRLTHAYFGAFSLGDALTMAVRHLQHHRTQF